MAIESCVQKMNELLSVMSRSEVKESHTEKRTVNLNMVPHEG